MLPAQELIAIMCPSLSGLFVGFWIFLTMAWVIRWGRNEPVEDDVVQVVDQVMQVVDDVADVLEDVAHVVDTAVVPVPTLEMFESLRQMMNEEKEKNERTQEVLYQLLGGLYNQETQENTMMYDVNYLYNRKVEREEGTGEFAYETAKDTVSRRKEHMYPTTRQGDENAKEIKQLKYDIMVSQDETHAALQDIRNEVMALKEIIEGIVDCVNANEVYMRLHDLEEKATDQAILNEKLCGNGSERARWFLE
jgi:hypothetical protein